MITIIKFILRHNTLFFYKYTVLKPVLIIIIIIIIIINIIIIVIIIISIIIIINNHYMINKLNKPGSICHSHKELPPLFLVYFFSKNYHI